MSAPWLVYALLTGLLIALAAHALDGVARVLRWPTRWIWAASLLASLVVIASAARPVVDVVPARVLQRGIDVAAPGASVAGSAIAHLVNAARLAAQSAIVAGVSSVARWLPAWTGTIAAVLWMLGTATALTVFSLVQLRLRRARRTWPTAHLHGHRVRIAPAVGPAVLGLLRPEIVVPQWLLDRAADEQRLVLAHEEEHAVAHDHLLLTAACVVVALVPWHPAAWWSLARLRLALELDCDARVLRRGAAARSYGEMLIDLAGQCSGFQVGATALADKTSHLERRLLAMRPSTQPFTRLRIAGLFVAAGLSLAAACEARVPTSAEVQSMDAASAERLAGKTLFDGMHAGPTPEFYVNDVKVSAADAHAISANDIATVNVEKSDAGAVIRIKTLAGTSGGMKYRTGAPAGSAEPNAAATMPRSGLRELHEKLTLSDHQFDGLILINGVRADVAALHALDPRKIAGVEVIKGAAAEQISSDPAARNGIIRVTTK